MSKLSVDVTETEVLKAVAEYLNKKYNVEFVTGSLRPCYDNGIGCADITGYNFTGSTKQD
jgi:hypothetical protein